MYSSETMKPSTDISRLYEIMAALRDPKTGCAWDLAQDFASIRHFTIEEAYEVADAIEREDYVDLRDELGDLLLQPIFHAQLASEQGLFDIDDVILSITQKLIRRHPHVFGDVDAKDPMEARASWDRIKQLERDKKQADKIKAGIKTVKPISILDDVPKPLPSLSRADKLSKRAATVGFDWPNWQKTYEKCTEELDEVKEAIEGEKGEKAIGEEIGDALFALANLARHLDIDPEAALRDANKKFTRRFAYVEQRCKQDDIALNKAGLERLDGYWNEIRQKDKQG